MRLRGTQGQTERRGDGSLQFSGDPNTDCEFSRQVLARNPGAAASLHAHQDLPRIGGGRIRHGYLPPDAVSKNSARSSRWDELQWWNPHITRRTT